MQTQARKRDSRGPRSVTGMAHARGYAMHSSSADAAHRALLPPTATLCDESRATIRYVTRVDTEGRPASGRTL